LAVALSVPLALLLNWFCSITLGSVDFHLVNLQKNYSEAKTYCREMHTDLATVHNSTDMKNLLTSVSNATVRAWIGLEAGDVWMWHWSGPDPKLDFLSWRRGEPLNSSQDACAAMDEGGGWFESDCGAQRSFVCGNSETGGDVFVAETKSWRDAQDHCRDILSDLVGIHSEEKNEAVLNVSGSRSVWIGLFRDPWKWSDGSASSFRYWKPRQPNHLRDYLILVQENMTWLEALSYCRRHHDDLVQITNKDVQEKVAELAQNATSPHVWIGLRYACSFGFWFWTSSATGCYLNWAPGQESEGKYDCGVTGAVEATRGQQWVSLSETATLNFICMFLFNYFH
uniref:C-type lectin domain-containing protein n=1 Tax=Mola mola TaxID=94237 RepID=A0A3Q3VXW4_MOLML